MAFAKLPIVLNSDGSLWAEACIYLLDRAKLNPTAVESLGPIASDLSYYKNFLDDFGFEWDDFNSPEPYDLPTYQFRNFLWEEIGSERSGQSTAARRISSVVGFYRHLQRNAKFNFKCAFDPWQESSMGLKYKDKQGFSRAKEIVTTDISIPHSKTVDPFSTTIDDGGKLRPLLAAEQTALMNALHTLENTEMTLMHLVAVLTGGRTQTVLTFRVRHFKAPPSSLPDKIKLRCGPGTGIDTKNNKSNVYLTIPKQLYVMLHVYANSARAQHRRTRSDRGDDDSNYLFLTQHGNPYYESIEDRIALRELESATKSAKIARGLRKFIEERVIPEVQKEIPNFNYSFHDLRATFGMNFVDYWEVKLKSGKANYSWILEQLRALMWHSSAATTERYLKYREHHHLVKEAQGAWDAWFDRLTKISAE